MKTAMQELIIRVLRNGQYIPIQLQEEMLEKEKNQIIKAHNEGIWHKEKCFDEGEFYYNQTYNQKQHIIDIMKADEDYGLYNQNKI